MGQLLIRNLDDAVVLSLKAKAKAAGKSLEQYLRDLLTEEVEASQATAFAKADKILAKSAYKMTHFPEDMIREDRDSR